MCLVMQNQPRRITTMDDEQKTTIKIKSKGN